jgi:hypothetical protein
MFRVRFRVYVRSFVPYKYNIICLLFFFFHNKKNVFGLSIHHLFNGFLLPLQIYVSANICFAKCVLLQLLVLPSATSFVCCQIHFGKFFFFFFFAQ